MGGYHGHCNRILRDGSAAPSLGLEKELLALADNEERFHGVRADWSLSDASNFARSILSGHELLLEQQPVGTRPGPTETRNSVEV